MATPGTTWYVLPQGGAPLLVSSVPRDCGIWASPLEAGLIPGWLLPVPPKLHSPRRAPFLDPYSQSSFPATHILPTTNLLFPKCNIIRAALTRARKRIINLFWLCLKVSSHHLRHIFYSIFSFNKNECQNSAVFSFYNEQPVIGFNRESHFKWVSQYRFQRRFQCDKTILLCEHYLMNSETEQVLLQTALGLVAHNSLNLIGLKYIALPVHPSNT